MFTLGSCMQRRYDGRFFGCRVNCELVPALPAWAVRRVLDDPREIPYLLVWNSRRDGTPQEAVRVACLERPTYLPEADSVEVKRTDGTVVRLRLLSRDLPRGNGTYSLLACPWCCGLNRCLYGWEAGGEYTHSALRSSWQCRRCAGLRYASEGGALVLRGRGSWFRSLEMQFGRTKSDRPEPWYPELLASAAED
jgi:hypothetical protein